MTPHESFHCFADGFWSNFYIVIDAWVVAWIGFQIRIANSLYCEKLAIIDDEFYVDGGNCEKLYDFAKTARNYVKKNNGGVALHDYLNYKTKDGMIEKFNPRGEMTN